MGLSFAQIALVLLVALVVIGPKRLPEVAKSLGKGYGEFKRTFGDFKKAVDLNDTSSPKQNTGANAATYKSRWEEQTADTQYPPDTERPAGESVEKIPTRAKRGANVNNEDNNGANG